MATKRVKLDAGALERLHRSLITVKNGFAEGGGDPESMADDIGPGNLVDKAKDFGKDCKKNYRRQAEDLDKLIGAITPVLETFEEIDEELGKALKDKEGAGPRHPGPGGPQAV